MEHRVAEDEVEGVVGERQLGRLAADGLHLDPQLLRRGGEGREHAGGDVGRDRTLEHARLEQVEREVAGAGPDLEPAPEVLVARERLVQLAEDLGPSYLAVGDAPLGVVVGGGEVVVADVGLANRFRLHRGEA